MVCDFGASASSGADIELSDDDKGKILRLALDDAIKRIFPRSIIFSAAKERDDRSTGPPATPRPRTVNLLAGRGEL